MISNRVQVIGHGLQHFDAYERIAFISIARHAVSIGKEPRSGLSRIEAIRVRRVVCQRVAHRVDCEHLRKHMLKVVAPPYNEMRRGGIIGDVEITSHTRGSSSRWAADGQYHWQLRDARSREFIPYKGQLGFFEVDLDEAADAGNTLI